MPTENIWISKLIFCVVCARSSFLFKFIFKMKIIKNITPQYETFNIILKLTSQHHGPPHHAMVWCVSVCLHVPLKQMQYKNILFKENFWSKFKCFEYFKIRIRFFCNHNVTITHVCRTSRLSRVWILTYGKICVRKLASVFLSLKRKNWTNLKDFWMVVMRPWDPN